jgi:hypothetical protein
MRSTVASDKTGSSLLSGCLSPIFAALVFIAPLPTIAASFFFLHPDEKHYTNGLIYMMQSADWLTPRNAKGSFASISRS